mgnify:CR=1 FL=1
MKNSVLCYLEETVKKYPDKLAITDGENSVTFSEWKNKALRIADVIEKHMKKHGCPILVYLPKGTDVVVSFAAILYSRNYYTPTDVEFPFRKVKGILNALQPELIVSTHDCAKKLLDNGVDSESILYIDDIDFSVPIVEKNRLKKIIDVDLAYVFFTSGSTGVPKGVAITQRSIIDYIDWAAEEFDITEKERIANQAPFYFDNSILDIYLCMSKGATLFITPRKVMNFQVKLLEYLQENQINFIFWVPSALVATANSGLLGRFDLSELRKVLFCGEVMQNAPLNIWRKALPDVQYANLYGPTEITDVCCYYKVNRDFADEEPLPIGQGCRNTQIILLDDNNEVIEEQGEIGELCVRGTSLSVGYYANYEKTREVFVQNPLNPYYEEKLYRTGDLAHYNQYGEIMFDGRKDFQIKYKGYRIELGEIETALIAIKGVNDGCVVYNELKEEIVAFYTGKEYVDKKFLRKELIQYLPQYMVPRKYIKLEKLLYNDNGKIDRKKLENDYL